MFMLGVLSPDGLRWTNIFGKKLKGGHKKAYLCENFILDSSYAFPKTPAS